MSDYDMRRARALNALRLDLSKAEGALHPPSRRFVTDDLVLHHYTSPEGLRGILKDSAFWCTNAGYVNDEHELAYPVKIATDVVKNLIETAADSEIRAFLRYVEYALDSHDAIKSWYIMSFSLVGDALSQWRAYCASGGYEIALNASEFVHRLFSPHSYYFGPVIYDPQQQRDELRNSIVRYTELWPELDSKYEDAEEILDDDFRMAFVLSLFNVLAQQFVFHKAPAFVEEQEWRVARQRLDGESVEFRLRNGTLTPYVIARLQHPEEGLPLRGLTVSPLGDVSLARHSAWLLTRTPPYDDVLIDVPDYKLRF